ncbi:MAG: hypothetical protein ACOYJH_02995 [Anaerovoracaceae bacterium]|jgi:hypothetical protein
MIGLDENALICDLAETYGIFDYRALPPALVATLASGLGMNSRIVKAMMGVTDIAPDSLLLAAILDTVRAFFDVGNVKTFVERMLAEDKEEARPVQVYDSVEDFRQAYDRIHQRKEE